jgi:hypothetical protein
MFKLLMRLTGGRPMKRGIYRFQSHLTGDHVYYFTDYFGRKFLAADRWSSFRVEVEDE